MARVYDPIDPHGTEQPLADVIPFERRRPTDRTDTWTCEACGQTGLVGIVGVITHTTYRCPA